MIRVETDCESGFECDYNIYYVPGGASPYFVYHEVRINWTAWRALGYDAHSYYTIDPNFISTTTLVPTSRLDYGANLGSTYQVGLSTSAVWTVCSDPATTNQNGTWQVGARVYGDTGSGSVGINNANLAKYLVT
jgi:hypothetical protein